MLNIEGIHNGIVIDHIKSGSGLKIFNYLRLDKCKTSVALIMNVPSGKIGKKDMIKIENVHDVDLNMLVLIDSNITINVIKNDAIIEKKKLKLPKTVKNLIKCKNPRCITSSEEYVPHIFYLVNEEKGQYRCEYCDELYNMND